MAEHLTHVERDNRGFYIWCEEDDCYVVSGHRYHVEAEAVAIAADHERNPG